METAQQTFAEELQRKIDLKTKPLGALGMLENLALQIGQIQQMLTPTISKPHIVVFAADHGIAATGLVNPYPQAVTAQMVLNFINGGAAINVFCHQNHIALKVVDSGVAFDFTDVAASRLFVDAKIAFGTANYLDSEAMTAQQAAAAIEKGREIVQRIASDGCNTIGFGEMGIGNTSSASLIMSNFLRLPIEECVGRGTGVNGEGLDRKTAVLKRVHELHRLGTALPSQILLQKVGGFEIATMCGAYLQAAEESMVILVDGFIATAALLLAIEMNKAVLPNCVFAHSSNEKGHRMMLDYLSVKPLLQLDLRLGEGTGAALALPLLQSAVAFLNDMASFETAGVSNKEA